MSYIGNSPTFLLKGSKAVFEYTATAGQTVFTGGDDNSAVLKALDDTIGVFSNGVRLVLTDDYTLNTAGDTVTLTSAAALNDIIVIETFDEIANLGTYTKAEADARYINTSGDITTGTIQVSGTGNNIELGANNKVTFNSALKVFHDGSDGFVTNDTGQLILRVASVESALVAVPNGAVTLYHDNTSIIATTSSGIDVTGTVTSNSYVHTGDTDTKFHFPADNQLSLVGGGAEIARAYQIAGAYGVLRVNGSGSATYPNFTFNGDDNTGMYRASTDTLGFTTAGAEKMRIDASGQVGIGVTPTHKLEVAGTTKAEQYLLDAIAKDISDTAVDVFIYDTRKDSDSGAWRKRTQHTSWYNETLNTATRGSRKEFPAVAVIVAESNQVTIYDGDDPNLPMWMVFNSGSGGYHIGNGTLSSISAINGLMFSCIQYGAYPIDFIKDTGGQYNASGLYIKTTNIASRNTTSSTAYQDTSKAIVNSTANDVAMTVLPNAPIDAATGLPVPTIAVATGGGVSVIKGDGTVVDITTTSGASGWSKSNFVAFRYDNKIVSSVGYYSNDTSDRYVHINTIPSADFSLGNGLDSVPSDGYHGATGGDTAIVSVFGEGSGRDITSMTAEHFGQASGLSQVAYAPVDTAPDLTSMVAYTTSDYATGWMNGNIKLATLSDTDDTNVTGAELVTNGTFNSVKSPWVGGSWAWQTDGSGGGWLRNSAGSTSTTYQTGTGIAVGTKYGVTFTVGGRTAGNVTAYLGSAAGTVRSANGTYSQIITCSGDTILRISGNSTFDGYIDNVSVRLLAEEDRSVNGNGLQVFGTVTKTAVATGADLVQYTNASTSDYLMQPHNSDIDFAGDFAFTFWARSNATGQYTFFAKQNPTTGSNSYGSTPYLFAHSNSSDKLQWYYRGTSTAGSFASSASIRDGIWHHFCLMRSGGTMYVYIDGKLDNSVSFSESFANTSAPLYVGIHSYNNSFLRPLSDGGISLFRISATAPSPEQIKKIYEDEKFLFQENAKATLYGSSDAVTALAYDDDTELLHVGTSAGRSVFQGLRRIDNTTDAVGAAISASNGMVAED